MPKAFFPFPIHTKKNNFYVNNIDTWYLTHYGVTPSPDALISLNKGPTFSVCFFRSFYNKTFRILRLKYSSVAAIKPSYLIANWIIYVKYILTKKTIIIILGNQSLTDGRTRFGAHAGPICVLASVALCALATTVLVCSEHFAFGIADSLRRGPGRLRGATVGAAVGRRGLARGRAVVEARRHGATGAVRCAVGGHVHQRRLGLALCE